MRDLILEPPERLDSLTGLRFFAALVVVLLHTNILLGGRLPAGDLWANGTLGVTFFFVLSGFVLTWTAKPSDSAWTFWRKRVARVLPLYLAMMLIGEALLADLPIPCGQFAVNGSGWEIYAIPMLSVALLQAWIAPFTVAFLSPSASSPDAPGWSLSVEALFYAVFPAFVPLFSKLRERGLVAAAAVDLTSMVVFYSIVRLCNPADTNWLGYFPVFQLGFFVAGVLTALAVRRGTRFPPLPVAIAAVGILGAALTTAVAHRTHLSSDLPLIEMLALPFLVLLVGSAAKADFQRKRSPFRNHLLVTLGVWSYAMYLVQMACFMIASCIFPAGLSSDHALACLEAIGFVGCVIAAAGLAHLLIEAPANRRLRHASPAIV